MNPECPKEYLEYSNFERLMIQLRKRFGVPLTGLWTLEDTFLYDRASLLSASEVYSLLQDPQKLDAFAVQLKLTR